MAADRIEIHIHYQPPVRVVAPARGPSAWLIFWPLIPLGVMAGIAVVLLIAIIGLVIVVAGVVLWMAGYVLVALGWVEAGALMDAGTGTTRAPFRAVERMSGER
jgi:hypothetical protein